MSRRSGKTVELIRRTVENDGAIIVSSDARAEDIKARALQLGLKPPRVVVMARGQARGISIVELLVDHQDDTCRPAVTLHCEAEQTAMLNYQSVIAAIRKMGDLI